ncbi:hypothetical protein GDO78_016486 [Eleutherodactylus coqui]|uniref:Uncharacterized protein n=1 Tax=Eleutherodactylus coqui TaxID=57060 RepID=A0A8J6EQW1_ELECQ|nr:hypothetical protein GDO78_016486 [Eleutherodactylus coqui]
MNGTCLLEPWDIYKVGTVYNNIQNKPRTTPLSEGLLLQRHYSNWDLLVRSLILSNIVPSFLESTHDKYRMRGEALPERPSVNKAWSYFFLLCT